MKTTIASIRSATAEEWDTTWRKCDYATYFHSREWAEIWEIYTQGNMRPSPQMIQFSDGYQAVLPFSTQKLFRGLVSSYISSPADTFGGWISTESLKPIHVDLLTNFLTQKVGDLVWRINPYDIVPTATIAQICQMDETHSLQLPETFTVLEQQWKRDGGAIARKAKKARREGVSIQLASSLKDWQIYYQIYEDSLRRWADQASSHYNWLIFELMFRCQSPAIKLWLAIEQEQIIAGALCFYAKKHVVYWHGAALESHFRFRPVNLLMWEIIKNACELQYSWFDFNPSGGHEGVKRFKQSFGARAMQCPTIQCESAVMSYLKTIKYSINKIRVIFQ